MKQKIKLTLFALVFVNVIVQAQPTMSLKEAVKYALNDNTDIKKQNLSILQSRQKAKEVVGQGLPQINGSAQLNDNLILPTTVLPGEIFGSPGTQMAVKFGVQYSMPLSVHADQLLYNQAYLVGIQQAKAAVTLSETNNEKIKQDVVYNVASAYYQAIIVREQGNLIKANLEKVQQSLNVVQSQYDNQMARKIDLDQLKVTLANTQTDFENSQVQFSYTLDNLKILMGYPVNDTLILNEKFSDNPEFIPQNTVSKNPKISLLKNQELLKQLEIKGIKAGNIPSLAAFASYGYQSQFNDWKGQIKFHRNSLIGLQLSVPIFDGLQRHRKVQQRQYELESIELDQQLLSNSLNAQYNNAVKKYLQNQKNVNNQEENLNLAKSVYDAMQNNYKNGLASLSDLINSDTNLKNAQTQYLTSLLQLKISSLDILYVNGNMNQLSN